MRTSFAKCCVALAAVTALFIALTADACTRALYVGDGNLVITGRSMDWSEDMMSNLWVFPAFITASRTGS